MAPIGEEALPEWLTTVFPGQTWSSLRTCFLCVDPEEGAGLDFEASEFGYLIEGISETPGQEAEVSVGSVIVAIGGTPLLGLSEDDLEAAFGDNFTGGQSIVLLSNEELKAAKVKKEAERKPEGSTTVAVEGMVIQSLPARNRRRRNIQEDATAPALAKATKIARTSAEGAADAKQADAADEPIKFETEEVRLYAYRDHTADVILHSWGKTPEEAWAQVVVAFFGYMTELDRVKMTKTIEIEATGHDQLDLMYHMLDEFLFSFGSEFIICRRIEILELDLVNLKVRARGFGEKFSLEKHEQGTEIKAITMHQMKLLTPDTLTYEEGVIPRKESALDGGKEKEGYPYECYVLVDI